MKYADLLAKFKAGFVDEADLEGVSAEDWMNVRLEAGDGILSCALTGGLFADHADDEEDEDKPKKKKGKVTGKSFGLEGDSIPFVMVSDGLIPPFSDMVLANAWDVKQFKQRGSMVLWNHNMEETRPPIGKGSNVQRGVEMKRNGRSFKALTGDVTFVDRDIFPFAGMIHDLVDAKLLTNASVGFDIVKMRAPSTEEQDELGMKPFSAIIQKASLFEFSITPIGRDENAQRLNDDGLSPLEAKLAEFSRAGVHSGEIIGEFREQMLSLAGKATRVSVTKPEFDPVVEDVTPLVDEPITANDTENVTFNSFTITPDVNGDIVPLAQFADTIARTELAALRDSVAKLTASVERLQRSRDEELYELLLSDSADEVTPEVDSSHGSGAPVDEMFSAATELGF